MHLESDNYFYSHSRKNPNSREDRYEIDFQMVFEHVGKDKQIIIDINDHLINDFKQNINGGGYIQ